MRNFVLTLTTIIGITMTSAAANAETTSNTVYMDLEDGRVTIELKPELAPKHVEQIKTLVSEGFYDGIVFHRVIEDFMAQTGDPTGTGTGRSHLPNIPAEFTDAHFGRGTVGMARSANPDSANSQFFICFQECGFLDGQYTVFGQVTDGMEVVDAIEQGEPPLNPDKIITMKMAPAAAEETPVQE